MSTRRTSSAAHVLGLVLGGLLLAPPAAHAQSAVSSVAPALSGIVLPPGGEALLCSGQANVSATAVADPIQPRVLVSIDATKLSCVGVVTGARYVNTGQARLTRLLVPKDVIRTTFAVYQDVPGGFLEARTALLILSVSYDATTGAITSAAAGVGNFQ